MPLAGGLMLTLLVLVATSCGSDEGPDTDEATATVVTDDVATATADSSNEPTAATAAGTEGGADRAAQGTMDLGGQVHELDEPSCSLPEQQDGPLRITADTTDGRGSLLVVGVGGLSSATIEYDGISYRSPGIQPTVDGSAVGYTGRASPGPLPSDTVDFGFSVVCP